jgi:nucleoid-associated protein YgaU
MTIYLGSRYEDSTVDFVAFTENTDALPVVFYEFSEIGRIEYTEYTWKEGDRLDNLAMEFYNDPEKWWLIPEYNPEIEDASSIPAGKVLRIANV